MNSAVNTAEPLGIAMIGHAFMGKAHSNAWRQVGAFFDAPAVDLRVMVGRNRQALDAAADRLGWAETSTDWRATIARDDIHIVDVCTPGALHAEIAIAALEAGKHVIVEKPIANTLAEAERMAAAARAAASRGIHAIVNFNYRRVPALALARELIAAGRIGDVREVRAAYLQDWLSDANAPMSWRLRKPDAGSGALGDLGSHVSDITMFLTGETITSVSGSLHTFVTQRPNPAEGAAALAKASTTPAGQSGASVELETVTVDDAAWATARLSGGGVLQFEVSRVALGRKNGLTIEIFGERGAVRFDLENLNELWFFDGTDRAGEQGFRRILVTEADHPYVGKWWPDGHIIGWEHTFVHQFAEFLSGIRNGTPTSPSFDDGLRVQRVLDAVERSHGANGSRLDTGN